MPATQAKSHLSDRCSHYTGCPVQCGPTTLVTNRWNRSICLEFSPNLLHSRFTPLFSLRCAALFPSCWAERILKHWNDCKPKSTFGREKSHKCFKICDEDCNTRHKSLKQEHLSSIFSKFLTFTLHTFVLTQMCRSPFPMLSRAYFGALKWLQTQINIGEGKITQMFQDLWRGL